MRAKQWAADHLVRAGASESGTNGRAGKEGVGVKTLDHTSSELGLLARMARDEDPTLGVEARAVEGDDALLSYQVVDPMKSEGESFAGEKRRSRGDFSRGPASLQAVMRARKREFHAAIESIGDLYDQMLGALGAALDVHDDEASGHSLRVSRYALQIAQRLGCSQEELDNLGRASRVHDIGKIGIPDAILLKPGKLTEEEMAVMQAHVLLGYEIVSRIGFMAPAAEIVLTHHERWDGDGYPQRLRGEEIPLGARIFAVADALDAITSDRPYRPAAPFAAARAEIERESGRQFDPRVVQAFLSIPEDIWEKSGRELAELRNAAKSDMPKLIMVWHRRSVR
jgi:HD-GYP domain-containing protein (c-di-GMP phosphodiesterase class II)